jgi:hypothetical protein
VITKLRALQVLEWHYDGREGDVGGHCHDGLAKRYIVYDIDERAGVASLAEFNRNVSTVPLKAILEHMVVVKEPDELAELPPTSKMTKDDVFRAVCDFNNHENDCPECIGEVELCDPSERLKYLCDEGRRILAWWAPAESK